MHEVTEPPVYVSCDFKLHTKGKVKEGGGK